jgi:hypothetical protein
MLTITANEIKKQGISSLHNAEEALITIRGKPRYVILDINSYEKFREMELIMALDAAKKEIAKGKYHVENPEKHIERITK